MSPRRIGGGGTTGRSVLRAVDAALAWGVEVLAIVRDPSRLGARRFLGVVGAAILLWGQCVPRHASAGR